MDELAQFSHNDYEIEERDVLYQGIFRIARYQVKTRLFKGGWSNPYTREVMERGEAVAVLLYDPQMDYVVLIEQFRAGALAHPVSPWLIEIVAGMMDPGEKPAEVALREAVEEAGCQITELYPICEYFASPGATNEYLHIFCGRVNAICAVGIYGLEHENEDIRLLTIPADDAFAKVREGKIRNASAIIALQWLELNHKRLRDLWLNQIPLPL